MEKTFSPYKAVIIAHEFNRKGYAATITENRRQIADNIGIVTEYIFTITPIKTKDAAQSKYINYAGEEKPINELFKRYK